MAKRNHPKYLYIATTRDKYELPIAVADSVTELAEMLGMSPRSIACLMTPSHQKDRKGFYRVPWEDLED